MVAEFSEPIREEPSESIIMETEKLHSYDTPNIPPAKQKSKVVKPAKKNNM